MLRGSELAAVRDQLGREPTVAFTVVASCAAGHPLVIANATRDADGTPFPTTYWLTCPAAVKAVSRLESTGAIGELDAAISADPVMSAELDRAHAEAAALRGQLEPGAETWGGVAGTRRGLKCLHAHYANHLAGAEDLAGRWTAERVEPIHPGAAPAPIVAAIDQGTNSTRLLVLAGGDPPVEIARDLVITRLGQQVDSTGRLHPDALVRVDNAISRYASRARALGAITIVTGATSAVRDATNSVDFVAIVERATGRAPEIIDGDREAALSFAGATAGLNAADGPFAVVDIGGGSTELVVGAADGSVSASVSLQMGSVRMTERHLRDDPPADAQLEALAAEVDAVLTDSTVPIGGAAELIAVAGTAVTVQALAMGLDRDDPDLIHGSTLTIDAAAEMVRRLGAMTIAERDVLPPMPRGRGEVILAGAVILHRVMVAAGFDEMRISETDILDGLAAELLRDPLP